jgi:peptidoglycan/LPS O-acetylase OafA/YrhL
MLIIVIPVSVFAFLSGYRRHRNSFVMATGAAGLVILAVGGTYAHSRYGLTADRALTIAGSLLLAIAHFRNSRLSRHAAAAAH